MTTATCPWCDKEYVLVDGKWPRHNRSIGNGEPRRRNQHQKRCEGSGATHLTDEQAARIHSGESSVVVLDEEQAARMDCQARRHGEGQVSDFQFKTNDRVEHVREPGSLGTVIVAEENGLSCQVHWDDGKPGSIDPCAWVNKLRLFEE